MTKMFCTCFCICIFVLVVVFCHFAQWWLWRLWWQRCSAPGWRAGPCWWGWGEGWRGGAKIWRAGPPRCCPAFDTFIVVVKGLGMHLVSLRCGNDCHCFVKVLGICHVSMCHCNCFVKVLGIHPVYLRCGNDYLCFCLSFRNMSHINVSL